MKPSPEKMYASIRSGDPVQVSLTETSGPVSHEHRGKTQINYNTKTLRQRADRETGKGDPVSRLLISLT